MNFFRGEEASPRRDLAVLALAFGLLFFQFLGRLPLIDPDEGRYAEIPREMLARGDFVTPTLNYVKYFEKPPLHYWLNALSLTVFGENEFAARFAGTLCGLATVLIVYWLGRTLFGRRSGLLGATVLGTATGFLVQSRINLTDMTVTCFLTAAFACFIMAARDGARHKVRDYYLFYIFMALAVLAKGLIGIVLPGAVILLYLLLTRRWSILREMRICSGTLLFLAVCAPWFVLVSARNPEFPYFFFIHEHFQRFLTKVHHRYRPVWFFIPVLLGTMLPWSLFIPAAVVKGWRARKIAPDALFLLLWAGVIFAFFSMSSSKLVPYILPVFPPLALLMGRWFGDKGNDRLLKWQGVATALLLICVGSAALAYPHTASQPAITATDGAILGGLFLAQGAAALIAAFSKEPLRLFASLAATACVVAVCGPPIVYKGMTAEQSAKDLAAAINRFAGPDARIACFDHYEQSIPFYTRRRVIVVGDRDELEFGSRLGANAAWFIEKQDFAKVWDSPAPVFATVRKGKLAELAKVVATPPQTVAETGNRLLVTNHPLPR